MFDRYSRTLLFDVPELTGLTGDSIARELSRAYLALLQLRINPEEARGDIAESLNYLRRLANALTFHIILNVDRPLQDRRAAAFSAAESIALLSDFLALEAPTQESQSFLFIAQRFARVESALLYLFAQYDACAAGVLSATALLPSELSRIDEVASVWCISRIEDLCRLRPPNSSHQVFSLQFRQAATLLPKELSYDTIGRLYVALGTAVVEFSRWLVGDGTDIAPIIARIEELLAQLTSARVKGSESHTGHDYARIYHIATLLRLLLPDLSDRALCHAVPVPPDADPDNYRAYLTARAKGSEGIGGRPILWPSAAEYVQVCLQGDTRHAVVSMPTGSGKSFVAELAITQAVHSGWVLYLTPTNALAEQIRGDLRIGLSKLKTEKHSFIGDQDYTTFSADRVSQMQTNTVAVMTPEKCALALRLSPEAFENCSLVVFDECHLIGDTGSTRGATSELVIAHLMLRAPNCRFLLMSAIIQNPDDLANWLKTTLNSSAKSVSILWRPTRTLRSVLGVEDGSFQAAATKAKTELSELPERRKQLGFASKCALAACLQGAWQSELEPDYGMAVLDCDADLAVIREKKRGRWEYAYNAESWVNGTSINLATLLAKSRIQTLVFTPASKHYPFSNGGKIKLSPELIAQLPERSPIVELCKILAEYELGVESAVFSLLDRGVAVHTSLMLEVEKIASESAFRSRSVPIMFATGTLAQGLNLPAIAVVIAGTRIGDPRGQDAHVVEQRKLSQLLNAAGRAGRAGFANQGVVITIPDKPVSLRDFNNILQMRLQADFLQHADNAVAIGSGLSQFLDNVCRDALESSSASDVELEVISLLAGGDENQPDARAILRNTYASFLRRQASLSEVTAENVQHLTEARTGFLEQTEAPEWLTIAAQRAGLDFFLTLAIYRAWDRLRPEWPTDVVSWSVVEWLEEFLSFLPHIPPGLVGRHLPPDRLGRVSDQFKQIHKDQPTLAFNRSLDWVCPTEWESAWGELREPLLAWMRGDSIAAIAAILTGVPAGQISSERTQSKQIPRALNVVMETWSSLSLIAGGFLAIAEQLLQGAVPLPLACLPMSIKYGCNSPGTLGWFRFGVRLRRASRLLAIAFPPPADLSSDEAIKDWVRSTRKSWMKNELAVPATLTQDEIEVLDSVRDFLKVSRNEPVA